MSRTVSPTDLRHWLGDGLELALLDAREEGTFSKSHLLQASCVPLSRLELVIADLVPRRTARIVLCDGGEGLAERAAERLAGFGYGDVAILAGGIRAWAEAGFELFSGINVPSKAFGEFVEHAYGTPSVSAEELKGMLDQGRKMVVLDSRPMEEFNTMSIPTGVCCPGAELVYRLADVAPDPETLVVVNCAGRTRSIIGAQSLINAGVANKVVALRNGTMGWHLAGLAVDRGETRRAPPVSEASLGAARRAAARVAKRFAVKTIDRATLAAWRTEADRRTLYVLDVRQPEEFAAGHLKGSVSAPGGQLVQATDKFAATRNARLVLVDDTGVRATMTASWLVQMGWDVAVLADGLSGQELVTGARPAPVLGLDRAAADEVSPGVLQAMLAKGEAAVVDLALSGRYKRGHVPGAWYAVRARLGRALAKIGSAKPFVFTSEDGVLAHLAACDAATLTGSHVWVLAGGNAAWVAAGFPMTQGMERLADEPDDVWLRAYDLDTGVEAAMNAYLTWEIDLVHQIERDGTMRFAQFPA